MAKSKWYLKGKDGQKRADQEDAAAKKRREEKSGPWRFRLKNDESAKIIFLDNPEFFFYEHSEKIGRDFVTATCIGSDDNCPACDAGFNPSYVVVCSVLDLRKYEDREGTVHKIQKKLFIGKSKAREKLLKQFQKRNNKLRFAAYEMSRGSSLNECATGEDFEFLKYIDPKSLAPLIKGEDMTLKELVTPFDYEKLLSPKTAKELRKLFGGSSPVGSDDDKTGEDDDLFDDSGEGGSDDDLFDDDSGESGEDREDEVRDELKKRIKGKKKPVSQLKALLEWRNENDLKDDVKIRQSSDPDEVIDELVAAFMEKSGEGGSSGDLDLDDELDGGDDSGGKDDVTDIDDII